ncbi:MAG: 1-deoxy-D-xylulose-5-phosphate reductoisomerase [Lachnospiraceae bacterium]|nr:1-deoxy-D-xylulose-5-phosphate reductoisomerase [Lachnospiraceae bacterium]
MKKISILGSTGSIGTQTLDIAREHKEDFEVVALSCGKNIDLVFEQIKEFMPGLVSVENEALASTLSSRLLDEGIKGVDILYGMDGLLAVATAAEAEIVVTAVVGMIGIRPTIAAIEAKKDIALANKETLVCAGHIIMPLAKKMGVSILPVDSEHSAIFQSLQGNSQNKISRIILTASGGPFRGRKKDEIKDMTAKDALKHPNWVMGKKVTIDSSTLANKGLEVMEAKWLFDVDIDQIVVTVHPQSILHSAVEYEDGSVVGQMGVPDMRLPIQYALLYPNRKTLSGDKLDLFKVGSMTFEAPDLETFKALALALKAGKTGGSLPTVFNAANEVAVAKFLNDEIRFFGIPEMIEKAMDEVKFIENPSVTDILEIEKETYRILG